MSTVVVLITGFAQPERISNGMADLCRQLSPLDVQVLRAHWKCDIRELANKVIDLDPTHIVVTGHSKGGNTGNNLCGLLGLWGYEVFGFVPCDAFGGHVGRDAIEVPKNVSWLYVFRGTKSAIKGSRVTRANETATCLMLERVRDDVRHAAMDELPEYRAIVMALAQGQHP